MGEEMKLHLHALILSLVFTTNSYCESLETKQYDPTEFITIAILAKDKAHTLPMYLQCIENQTWPAQQTYLYIRTNNNNDETVEVLRNWIARVGDRYAKIYFDDSDVNLPVEMFRQHEWNAMRFSVLGAIRQASVNWAHQNNSHYFVADCDNIIYPDTIEMMFTTNLPIVAPLLRCNTQKYYSNCHDIVDNNGYYIPSVFYYEILEQRVVGLIEVPVVHCTYFIRKEVLDKIRYDDGSERYEYVIFSDCARQADIPQYLDNRLVYGYISFAENKEEFEREPFLSNFLLP